MAYRPWAKRLQGSAVILDKLVLPDPGRLNRPDCPIGGGGFMTASRHTLGFVQRSGRTYDEMPMHAFSGGWPWYCLSRFEQLDVRCSRFVANNWDPGTWDEHMLVWSVVPPGCRIDNGRTVAGCKPCGPPCERAARDNKSAAV